MLVPRVTRRANSNCAVARTLDLQGSASRQQKKKIYISWGYTYANRNCPLFRFPVRPLAGLSGPRRDNMQRSVPWRGGSHLVRGVLGVGLALGCAPGHSPGADVAEVDLPLGGRASAGLTPHDDGAARQDLRGGGRHTVRGHSVVQGGRTDGRTSPFYCAERLAAAK